MSLTIAESEMTSDATRHFATKRTGPYPGTWRDESWSVSWLPGRHLTRNETITAMTIAETVTQMLAEKPTTPADHPMWPNLDSWAAELGLTGPDALIRVIHTIGPDGAEKPAPRPNDRTLPGEDYRGY